MTSIFRVVIVLDYINMITKGLKTNLLLNSLSCLIIQEDINSYYKFYYLLSHNMIGIMFSIEKN